MGSTLVISIQRQFRVTVTIQNLGKWTPSNSEDPDHVVMYTVLQSRVTAIIRASEIEDSYVYAHFR